MVKKTSELLQGLSDKCYEYSIYTHNERILSKHFDALDEAIKHFKQHESEEKDGNSK